MNEGEMKLSDIQTLGLCEFVELFEPNLTHQEKELFKLIEKGAFKFDINYLAQTETKIMSLVALWNLCSFKDTQTALLVPFNSTSKKDILTQCCRYLEKIEINQNTRFKTEANKISLNRSVICIFDDGLSETRLATLTAGIFCDHYILMAVDVDNLKPEHLNIACCSVTQKNWQCILARKVEKTQAVSFFYQLAIRDLLERGFYEEAYKESKLSWHPVDPHLPIEEIIKQTDDKFFDDVRQFYSVNQQAIFDQIDHVHSSMFLRHIQYEFQINSLRNEYISILLKVIKESTHKGYLFTVELSKQIEKDKDPRLGITAIVGKPTQEDISKLTETLKGRALNAMIVPSRVIIEPNPMVRHFLQSKSSDYVIACDFDAETTAALKNKSCVKIDDLPIYESKTPDLAEAVFRSVQHHKDEVEKGDE